MEIPVRVTSPFILDDKMYELGDITMLDVNVANPLIRSLHVYAIADADSESIQPQITKKNDTNTETKIIQSGNTPARIVGNNTKNKGGKVNA